MSRVSSNATIQGVSLAYCKKVTQKLYDLPIASFFRSPVDLASTPGYKEKIKRPMDLGTILRKLDTNQYTSIEKWKEDMNLVWVNALTYNDQKSVVHIIARQLQNEFKNYSDRAPRNEMQAWTFEMAHKQDKLAYLLELKPGPPNVLKPFVPRLKFIFK